MALAAALEALGCFLGSSWELLGGLWGLFGGFWGLLLGALGWPRGFLLYYLLCLNFILPLRGPALTEGRKESTSDFFGARRGAPGAKKGSWHYVFNENHEFP